MELVTLPQVTEHCKADSDDADLLTTLANGAERAFARAVNRNLYPSAAAYAAAVNALPAKMAAAYSQHKTAMDAAAALADENERKVAECIADNALLLAKLDMDYTLGGIVVDAENNEDAIAAILMTVAHYYENRSTVTAGQGSAAVELPLGAQRIADLMFRVSREFI